RLVGDYIYTQNDMVNGTMFDDAVVEEIRTVDVHYQQVLAGGAYDFLSVALYRSVPRYYVPFRSLYSVNIENLMMAGRCFSCSHIGLGGPRVMNTCGQMGIATGYAASLCKKYNTDPRGVYQNYIEQLKDLIANTAARLPDG
ncbi:MAG: FAD-dependent oxidoreductase, partial [Planctomycetota bacterium]